ncbi:hypothetical protein GJAV_G00238340 [Gymnothorax javanicus]|nr:hypothetical protein GJAV_G00238340 [Gymnothorax javanicus]
MLLRPLSVENGRGTRMSNLLLGSWAFLGACLLAGGETCPMGPVLRDLNGSHYQPGPSPDVSVGFLSGFVQSFLGTVQPNSFPKELVIEVIQDSRIASTQGTVNKVLRYEVGFLVCAAIGILYIILMPLVGFIFACCRCCGNCGGRMYQEQTKSIDCRRRGIYWALLVITVFILAGNVCMFRGSQSWAYSIQYSLTQSESTLDNIQNYLEAVPQDVDVVVNESLLTVGAVRSRLNNVGSLLGAELQKALGSSLNPALDSVRHFSEELKKVIQVLSQLNNTQQQLQPDLDRLEANLTAVRDSVNRTLQNPACLGCAPLRKELGMLSVETSFTIPNLRELQSAVDKVQEADLDSRVKEGEQFLDNLPERVRNETDGTVKNVNVLLDDTERQISQFSQDIPLDALTNALSTLEDVRGYINQYSPEVKKVERYSLVVGLILSCVILLVVLCNVLGLLLGPAGLKPKVDPTYRSGTAHCGGTFLMAGVGFSFLFSWLFMIVVLVLFLVGGNVHTLVCRPLRNQQLLQIIDTPGLIPRFQLSDALGLKTNLTIAKVYDDCRQDRSLWTTLHLEEVINLRDLLNVSKYTEEIQQVFNQSVITLPTITFLTPEARTQLQNFSNTAGSVDFSNAKQQLNNISRINLNSTADVLEGLAAGQNSSVREQLLQDATEIRRIQAQFETSILPEVRVINSSILLLEAQALEVNRTVGDMMNVVDTAQDYLNGNASEIVKLEIRSFVDCLVRYFTAYADWAYRMITEQLGRCRPVAGAVDSAEVIVCSYLAESLNAFWFSLGWCLIFLVPSIILSVKLAKFYRRMKYTDSFENHIQLNHIPRASLRPF